MPNSVMPVFLGVSKTNIPFRFSVFFSAERKDKGEGVLGWGNRRLRGQITPSSLIQLGLVCTQRKTLPHVFQFESHPVLYGSKPPTKTHETLSWMELPDNMTYCLWLRCWTVSGNSGLSLTSDQSKELRSMEESEHSTSPRSSFVAPNRERTLVIGLFWTNRSKCSLFSFDSSNCGE